MARFSRKKFLCILVVPIFSILLLAAFYVYTTVQNNAQNAQIAAWMATCSEKLQGQEFRCWVDGIESIIQRKGAHAAFAIISSRLLDEPSFKRSCNEILHDVGHWTYHYTVDNNIEFVMPPKVTLCASAFDRAFVHALISTTGDFVKAVKFCTDPQLASESPDATARCYHDIGHGALSFYAPRMTGEKPQQVIARALEECAKISSTPLQLDYCAGGVFSEVIKFYQTNKYGFSLNKEDPFSFCREQADPYRRMCYYAAKPLLLWLTNNDFPKAASFIESIVEDTYAIAAIDSLATSVTMRNIANNISVVDYAGDIFACRALQERLRLPCIAGLAIELLTHSSPVDALEFCRLSLLSEQERDGCFRRVAPNLAEWTPRDKIQEICSSLEEKYKEFCQY
ncbi:MAG: hypothetical protein G01um101429_943 [Parcubacteria group bacterium Gr01-1014_29]|nr:MAG: hypothetical protein G01um101429_943 [Parcubacteria group bacterium Gr01-1014_29]